MKKSKSNKAKGSAFEDKVIATINSGALAWQKGDAVSADYCYECKFTSKLGFRISQKILMKLWCESLESNKIPRLVIGLPKDENNLFILTCDLHIQKKG